MSKKYCSHCGYELRENVRFCPNFGTVVSENAERQEIEDEEPRRNSKSLYALLIVLGAILLIICGAVYFSDSQERREARLAREKFVADSLEQVRKDSIKLAEQKEKERIEAAEKEQRIASCKAFLEKFYKGLDGNQDVDEYVKKHVTSKALQFLKDNYDYECEGEYLATWLFSYEAGGDYGPLRERVFEAEDENTFQVTSIYELEGSSQYTAYEYVVRLGVVKEGNFYKIDTIEFVRSHPIIA